MCPGWSGKKSGNSSSGSKPTPAARASTGSGQKSKERGDPHPDGPPTTACSTHWQFGKNAYYCKKPWCCPWVNFKGTPPTKPSKN